MIQIYIEIQDKTIQPIVFELIAKAKELYDNSTLQNKGFLTAFSACALSYEQKKELEHYGIKKIYYLNSQQSDFYYDIAAQAFSKALDISMKDAQTQIVLIGGTAQGHLLASSLGIMKNTGITADCTELYLDEDNRLIQVRPAFSGNLMAEIRTHGTGLQIATIHENVFAKAEKNEAIEIEYKEINIDSKSKIQILDSKTREFSSEFQDITKSEKLVIIGNGISKQEDLEQIRKFAHSQGAKLAGTKLAIQKGLLAREFQVGLSGHTVSPKIAILFGISGSLQFLAGLANVKKIVAINNDKDAPIMKIAHYPILATIEEILPALNK